MKKQALTVTLASSLFAGIVSAASLDTYAWHKRVLIVFADNATSPPLVKQRELADHAIQGFTERDLIPVQVIGQSVEGASDSADALRKRYGVPANAFRVLLIGKDGGVKIDSSEPVEAQRLFTTIDAMPMRKQELQSAPKS